MLSHRMMNTQHEHYMKRALDLARLAEGDTSPNPGVGAVLVYNDRIIGEGFHAAHGQPHAEVMALRSVHPDDQPFISASTLYVTLEPCCIYGRTPPCTDLIIREQIPKVVISCQDRSPGVNGRGVALLRAQGVEVVEHVLMEEGEYQALIRNVYVSEQRPYIILKMAFSKDGFVGRSENQVILSNDGSWRLVHRLRHRVDAILVGTGTALIDNPQLTNRLFWGEDPIRIIPDYNRKLPTNQAFFQDSGITWILCHESHDRDESMSDKVEYKVIPVDADLPVMLNVLANEGITSILVEGGPTLIRSFIDQDCWDEAILSTTDQYLGSGIPGPTGWVSPQDRIRIGSDDFDWFRHPRYLANTELQG